MSYVREQFRTQHPLVHHQTPSRVPPMVIVGACDPSGAAPHARLEGSFTPRLAASAMIDWLRSRGVPNSPKS